MVRDAELAANDAAAVRIEAQAKAGELLREMRDRGERVERGSPGMKSQPATSLADLGVTKSESSRWQQVASVPAAVRAEYVGETKATGGEVSTDGLMRRQAEREAARREEQELQATLDRIDPEGAVRQRNAKLVAEWATAQARLSRAITDVMAFDLDTIGPLLDEINRYGVRVGIDHFRNYCVALEQMLATTATLQVIDGSGGR